MFVRSAVLCVVFTVACSPAPPRPDGGSTLVGGGSSSTGGGSVGGGTAGQGMGGGTADSGVDAGLSCTTFNAIAPPFDVPGVFTAGSTNNPNLEWWTSSIPLTAPNNRLTLFNSELYQVAQQRVTFPLTYVLQPGLNYDNCEVCFQASLSCDDMGRNCQAEFLATSGSFEFSEGTLSVDAGRFSGRGTNVLYRAWDYTNDRPASDTCFVVPSISFNSYWPYALPDAGVMTDGGQLDGGDGG